MTSQLTILSISDSLYLNRLKALVSSVSQNYPQVKFYCHLVNVERSVAESLQHIYSNLECNFDHQDFNSEEDKKAYCANIRADVMSQLMKRNETSALLYLDADSIVRKDLSELLQLIKNHDLVVLKRELAQDEYLKFAAGVIGVKNSGITQEFITYWANLVDKNIYEWYSDQLCFARTYEKFKSQLNTINLPHQFIDWEFLSTSSIWVGKGDRKDTNRLYLLEEEYYLSQVTIPINSKEQSKNLLEQQILALEVQNKEVKNTCRKLKKEKQKLNQEQEELNLIIQELREENNFLKSENQNLSAENQKMHREIIEIKSSNFWKMRKQWLKIKSRLNFPE